MNGSSAAVKVDVKIHLVSTVYMYLFEKLLVVLYC